MTLGPTTTFPRDPWVIPSGLLGRGNGKPMRALPMLAPVRGVKSV